MRLLFRSLAVAARFAFYMNLRLVVCALAALILALLSPTSRRMPAVRAKARKVVHPPPDRARATVRKRRACASSIAISWS